MADERLREATDDELSFSLQHALMFDGRKRIHHADDYMARHTADYLIKKLKESGYVVMKRPPPDTPAGQIGPRNIPMKD